MSNMNAKKTVQLRLKQFDITSIKRDSTIMVYGKRGSGKSVFVKCMMYHNKDIARGIVISGSEKHQPFYKDFIPDTYIFEEYDSDIISKVITIQKQQVEEEGKSSKNNTFIIMDDVLADVKMWKNDKSLRDCFFNGRHMNVMVIIIMQYCLALAPDLRSNFDYIFIFKDNNRENIKKLYQQFGGVCDNLKTFEAIINQGTQNNQCVVINNKSLSDKIDDCFFVYKACMHDKFRVGSPAYWLAHDKNYKGEGHDGDDDDEENNSSVKIVVRARGGG